MLEVIYYIGFIITAIYLVWCVICEYQIADQPVIRSAFMLFLSIVLWPLTWVIWFILMYVRVEDKVE